MILDQLAVPLNETQDEVCSTLVRIFMDNIVALALGLGKGLILNRRQIKRICVLASDRSMLLGCQRK